jgi:hypothetical protein
MTGLVWAMDAEAYARNLKNPDFVRQLDALFD